MRTRKKVVPGMTLRTANAAYSSVINERNSVRALGGAGSEGGVAMSLGVERFVSVKGGGVPHLVVGHSFLSRNKAFSRSQPPVTEENSLTVSTWRTQSLSQLSLAMQTSCLPSVLCLETQTVTPRIYFSI